VYKYLKILKTNSINQKDTVTKLVTDLENLFVLDRPMVSEGGILLIGVDLTSGIKFNAEIFTDEAKLFIYAQTKSDLISVSKTITKILGL
jgi:hypothetical protein